MVLYGDVPLVDGDFVAALHQRHLDADAAATLTTVDLDDPAHYGRIVRDADGRRRAHRRVQRRDAPRSARSTRSTSASTCSAATRCARRWRASAATTPRASCTSPTSCTCCSTPSTRSPAFESDDEEMCMGVNSRVELAIVNAAMRWRLLERLMLAGVTVEDPETDLRGLGRRGRAATRSSAPTRTCSGAPPSARPARSAPAASCATPSSATAPASSARTSTSASSARAAASGPFAYIRPNTVLAEGAKAGTFVEIKNSRIGEGSKVPHLSYVGDAIVGADSNIAAGNITANYDGYEKHATHDRRPRAHRQRHHHRGAGHHRRRRLHGGRLGDHARRARRARSASRASSRRTSTATPSAARPRAAARAAGDDGRHEPYGPGAARSGTIVDRSAANTEEGERWRTAPAA